LSARCVPYGAGLPYRPYLQLLAQAVGASIQDRPERIADALDALPVEGATRRPWLARLLGAPSAETEGLAPEAIQRGVHLAFADLFRALAHDGPLAICLEDVHWLDAASLGLTEELVRLCDTEPLLLHLTGRPDANDVLAQILPDDGDGTCLRLDLQALDEAAVTELASDLLGEMAQPALVQELIARTSGNPFFVEELLRSVAGAAGTAPLDALRDLPPTIEGVLSARIDELGSSARTVLGVASVIGRTVHLPLLRETSFAVAAVADGLPELVDTGFLDPDPDGADSLLFHHALVQDVAYGRLLRKQRRILHQDIAEAAERLWGSGDDHVALLARHHYLAETERAFDLLERAGEVARRVFANEEAILHLRRAVELAGVGDPGPRLERVLLQLARLLELTGAYEEALGLYERLQTITGSVEAWRGIVSTQRLQGRYPAAFASLAAAFDHVDAGSAGVATLWLELGRTHVEASQFREAATALQSGLEACGRSGRVGGELLMNLALAESYLGDDLGALATARAAEQILAGTEASVEEVTVLRIIGDIQYALGQHADAAATLRRGLELAEQVGSVEELGGCLINLGMVELARGDLDAAIECDRRALEEFERVRHGFGRAAAHGNLAEKLLHAGRHEEATRTCERALELARDLDDPIVLADVLRTRASLHLAADEPEAGARCAQEAADLAEPHAG
jgi:tetratricopeptide (TPR) repeat protein